MRGSERTGTNSQDMKREDAAITSGGPTKEETTPEREYKGKRQEGIFKTRFLKKKRHKNTSHKQVCLTKIHLKAFY